VQILITLPLFISQQLAPTALFVAESMLPILKIAIRPSDQQVWLCDDFRSMRVMQIHYSVLSHADPSGHCPQEAHLQVPKTGRRGQQLIAGVASVTCVVGV
jgi:hypothetical protein